MALPTIQQERDREFFAPSSLLPVASKCSFTIQRLESKATLDLGKKVVTLRKAYHLKKVQVAHEGDDHWFEVTGCPKGEFVSATGGNGGYAFTTMRDGRDNLVHRVELGRAFAVGEEFVLTVEYRSAGLEIENKLIELSSSWPHFRSALFRYDQGYSIHCDVLEFTVEVIGGHIVGAWPRALCTPHSSTIIHFKKPDLRPYEVVTPLVHVERGSRRQAQVLQWIVAFLLGVASSYVAGLIP